MNAKTALQQLKERFWQDDLLKMPRRLYPELSEAYLYRLWLQDYEPLLADPPVMADEVSERLVLAGLTHLEPYYLADPGGSWYVLVTLRYNLRTRYRFCYARYWWARDRQALRSMVQMMIETWAAAPLDWFKFRVGYGSGLAPADFHPQAIFQSHVVAGCPARTAMGPTLAMLEEMGLEVDRPDQVGGWWAQYRTLLDEQERLAPGVMEDWNDYETAVVELKHELTELLEHGGGIINLWQDRELVGHISWRPHRYREQLIQRCWHIQNIIVKASQRRQGLGLCLHRLALAQMNLEVSPIVAGLVKADNEASLKTAAKLGRGVVDSYVIVPNVERKA
jgi:hypothetical protein